MTFFGDNDNELYVKGCHADLGVVCCEHDYTYSTTDNYSLVNGGDESNGLFTIQCNVFQLQHLGLIYQHVSLCKWSTWGLFPCQPVTWTAVSLTLGCNIQWHSNMYLTKWMGRCHDHYTKRCYLVVGGNIHRGLAVADRAAVIGHWRWHMTKSWRAVNPSWAARPVPYVRAPSAHPDPSPCPPLPTSPTFTPHHT